MPSKPPTHKELTKKLTDALAALEANRVLRVVEPGQFSSDLDLLGSADPDEHFQKILVFLEEIIRAGGAKTYVGAYPPYKCKQAGFHKDSLYAFAWDSTTQGKKMYLKFGIRHTTSGPPTYLYLNCHEDAPEKKLSRLGS